MERRVNANSSTSHMYPPPPAMGLINPAHRDAVLRQDPRHNPQTGAVIARIEEILLANLDALRETRVLTIPIRSRRTGRVRIIRFPSSDDREAKKFTALLQILHLSYEALVAGTVITKRAIYYQNPELFGSQQYVDGLVDDIAFTFGLGRDALNIVATSKGLIAGAVRVTIGNGSVLDCDSDDGQGVLLPDRRSITSVDLGAIKWILVIEKEATFRGLVASGFHRTSTVGPGVLITAKGYPDLSTRQFLHNMHTAFPAVPVFGLVDFDPDGITILLTYKNGSRSLQHEEHATLTRLSWIGPRSDDVFGRYHTRPAVAAGNETDMPGLLPSQPYSSSQAIALPCPTSQFSFVDVTLPLKVVDRRKAVSLLLATIGKDDVENLDFVRELQVMLLLNTKAEIQAVDDAGDLSVWLESALDSKMNGM